MTARAMVDSYYLRVSGNLGFSCLFGGTRSFSIGNGVGAGARRAINSRYLLESVAFSVGIVYLAAEIFSFY